MPSPSGTTAEQLTATITPLPTASSEPLVELVRSFRRHLEAENKRPRTVQTYLESLSAFASFAESEQLPSAVGSIRREHVEAFIADLLTRAKPSTALVRYGALQQFFRWALSEDLIVASPMQKMQRRKCLLSRLMCCERTSCTACFAAARARTFATDATQR